MTPRQDQELEHYDEASQLLPTAPLPLSDDEDGVVYEGRIHGTMDELREQMKTAFPTLQSLLLTKIPWLISIRYAAGLGEDALAAAALATTLCNVTGLSLSVGLSSALTTLAGQAKGDLTSKLEVRRKMESLDQERDYSPTEYSDNNKPLPPIIFLYRGLVIQMICVIPIGLWWLDGIESTLISLAQKASLAFMTAEYLQVLAPALWFYSIGWTLTSWLQSIGMADVPVYAAAIGLALHVPFNWFFVYYLEWGFLGCAAATVCFQAIQPIYFVVYVFMTSEGRQRVLDSIAAQALDRTRLSFWLELKIAMFSLRGIFQYLTLALPGIVMISEWWASEISIFLSGNMVPNPQAALGGMTLYQSINTFCFMFPVAFGVAGSTRVSNLLGEGKPKEAKFAAYTSVACAGIASTLLGMLLIIVPHDFFPSLFAPGENDVTAEAAKTIPLLSTYIFADGLQFALNSIIKGCGRQCIIMPIVVIAYWFVGLPLAYYNAFVRHDGVMTCEDATFCGDVGLVAGMTTGTWVHMLLLAFVVVCTTNWEREARMAKQRTKLSK